MWEMGGEGRRKDWGTKYRCEGSGGAPDHQIVSDYQRRLSAKLQRL